VKVLLVAPNISARMGGEAILPLHYFRELTNLGLEVHALTHARVRNELRDSPVWRPDRFHFIEDSIAEKTTHRLTQIAPRPLGETVIGGALGMITMARLGKAAKRLTREIDFDLVHQPAPVSPALPSFLGGVRPPLVFGPLNGGMSFPPAFRAAYSGGSDRVVDSARGISGLLNTIAPGKLKATRILVANARTRQALPPGVGDDVVRTLVENGVDLGLWRKIDRSSAPSGKYFVYAGRLVWWKAVDLLVEAFERVDPDYSLVIVGDGPERRALEGRVASSAAAARIEFAGFKPQAEIAALLSAARALVLPSLRECGGAVVLEAFACGRPAIATDWGGPQDYITPETGILVPPTDRDAFIAGLADAMNALAADPDAADAMGEAARRRVEEHFSWEAKAAQMAAHYEEVVAAHAAGDTPHR